MADIDWADLNRQLELAWPGKGARPLVPADGPIAYYDEAGRLRYLPLPAGGAGQLWRDMAASSATAASSVVQSPRNSAGMSSTIRQTGSRSMGWWRNICTSIARVIVCCATTFKVKRRASSLSISVSESVERDCSGGGHG
ncbi:hypothetical protein [Ferrovibrio sp.]|uniref:hypothetical protein n=1 Tax=Ferrovibrio sp. TaxID=1917215 RepID=UPI003D0ED2CB